MRHVLVFLLAALFASDATALEVITTAKHKLSCDEIIQVKIKARINNKWRNQHVKAEVKQVFPFCTDTTPPPDPQPDPDPQPLPTGIAPPLSTAQSPRLEFMNQQMAWYMNSPYGDLNTWLYDRVQVLYELYLRTNDEDVHAEATKSAKEYVKHYTNVGSNPNYSDCNPGWSYAGVERCDVKFTYASACWYLLKVDGVDACSKDLLGRLHRYFMGYGWNAAKLLDADASNPPTFNVTERNMGYQFMGLIYINKLAREKGYTQLAESTASDIRAVIKWLYDWQAKYAYGGWMHSYNGHEGDDASPDYLIFSPWQGAILTGALWRAWDAGFVTDTCGANNEKCIPAMLVKYAQAMENYGWVKNPTDWMSDANASRQIAWYLAFPQNPTVQKNYQDGEGWYMDEHNPELQCVAALGYYFSKDAAQKASFKARYDVLTSNTLYLRGTGQTIPVPQQGEERNFAAISAPYAVVVDGPKYDAGGVLRLLRYDSGTLTDITNGSGLEFTSQDDRARSGTAVFADFNGDGLQDFIHSQGNRDMMQSNGDGTFTKIHSFGHYSSLPHDRSYVAVGDITGDGIPDLCMTEQESGTSIGVVCYKTVRSN